MGKKAARKTLEKEMETWLQQPVAQKVGSPIDCACVIHGGFYSFDYVQKLYRGLQRGFSRPVNLHVYTEPGREVPAPYIKHSLKDLGVEGPRKSWWYKTQLFDTEHFSGELYYFDLDIVIVNSIDWMTELSESFFWGVRDFRYLFNSRKKGLNSSIMKFNVNQHKYVWDEFIKQPTMHMNRMHGDQDFIDRVIPADKKMFFSEQKIKSWRWQLVDGGYDTVKRQHKNPGQGTVIDPATSVAVFHGKPKLHEIKDNTILGYWK